MAETQNYQNHVRWYPLVHFVITPILLVNLIWQIVRLSQEFNWDRAENLLLAVGLMLLSLAGRNQALMAQNRIIRLEETLRYREVLAPDLAFQAEQLPNGTKIALRFASDDELPELVQKAINGEFKNSKEIKLAVKDWRGDYLRV
jgi:hypothetical protein